MKAGDVRVTPNWLALREPADAAARSRELVEELGRHLSPARPLVIHDLGCGSGAMARWLAPLLPGPQHWVLRDRDPELLEAAVADPPGLAADGSAVTVETRRSDITRLQPGELAGAGLITASALLDMLTGEELARLVAPCAGSGCPTLLSLSVSGRVELAPSDPLDRRIAAAFNDHQRRTTERGRLLGPDAAGAVVEEFARLGAEVLIRPSSWRLGASEADLAEMWFTGWLDAACEQDPELAAETDDYRDGRLAQARAGELPVTVDHADLLAPPRSGRR